MPLLPHYYRPPATRSTAPVTYDAASERRNTTASATSAAVPARAIGVVGAKRSMRPGGWISVAMMPGATALTRMPSPASSRARPSVMDSIAPFDAAYQTYSPAPPIVAAADDRS